MLLANTVPTMTRQRKVADLYTSTTTLVSTRQIKRKTVVMFRILTFFSAFRIAPIWLNITYYYSVLSSALPGWKKHFIDGEELKICLNHRFASKILWLLITSGGLLRAFRVHLSSEGIVKIGLPVLGPLVFLIPYIPDLENEVTCNHLFFVDDVNPIAPRSQQHELRSSIQLALIWSRRWDLPLNASKSHHLSIGGHPNHRLVLSEEANGELMTKCEQINNLGMSLKLQAKLGECCTS